MEAAPHPWPAIGSLILRDGYVTKEELEEILRAQHDAPERRLSGWRLGEILVERGLMTQAQVAALVAEQYELPFLELDPTSLDRAVADLLPRDLAERFSAVPVEIDAGGALVLAVADPAAVLFSDELRRAVGRPLRFAVVAQDALDAALADEAPAETPGLALASWPSGGPAFDFPLERAAAQPSSATTHAAAPSGHSYPPLGTLLVRDGLVTEEELEAALEEQRRSDGQRLGEILVERGTLTRADVARVVAEQYELEFVDLASVEIDHRVAGLLPVEIASRHGALPLDFLPDGSLRLVVADPTKVLAPEEILDALGARLTFAVADPDLVESALAELRAQSPPSAISWPSLATIGPPLTGAHDRPHVDASDLIIVPADELPPAAPEVLERRDSRADEGGSDLAPTGEETTLVAAADAATAPESDATSKKKRRRGWFRRRRGRIEDRDDARSESEPETPEALETSTLDDEPLPRDPIAGLLRAGEVAEGAGETDDEPTARAMEQAAVLRLWIAGGDASTAAPDEGVADLDAQAERSTLDVDATAADNPDAPADDLGPEPPATTAEALASAPAEPAWEGESIVGASDDPEALDEATDDASAPAAVETPAETAADEVWNIFDPAGAATGGVPSQPLAPAEAAPPSAAPARDSSLEAGVEPELALVADGEPADEAVTPYWTMPVEEPPSDEMPSSLSWREEPAPEADDGSDVAGVEAEEPDTIPVDEAEDTGREPSWRSWEPPAGAADPWPADLDADAGLEEDVRVAVEPALAPEQPTGVEHQIPDSETGGDDWLVELEPDSPEDGAAPWELEDAPAADVVDVGGTALGLAASPLGPPEHEHGPSWSAPAVSAPALAPEPETSDDGGTLAPLVERAVALGASTLHFSAQAHGVVVRARVDGVLRKLETVTGPTRFELARELGLAAQAGTYAKGHVTALPTPHGETVTVRFRTTSGATTLEALTLDPADREAIERALRHPSGLVLVAGPAGAGRDDTLTAALHELVSGERAVMTIEDPIVHVVPGADQVAVDPSAGRGYAEGLRAIVAADPDAILVGELADEETARLAVDAATGHLVLTTVLAHSAVGALDRLSLLGVDADLVASTLALVVSQRSVRRLCDHCREGYYATPADVAALRRPDEEIGRRLLARGTGCVECGDTGFAGTIGVYEVLTPNDELRALIAASAPATEVERAARLAGKRTLSDDAVRLVLEGLTTVAEIQRVLGRAL